MKNEQEYIILQIQEDDYGCEERPAGEPLQVLVTLENPAGEQKTLLVADEWLYAHEIDEGSVWTETAFL